MTKPVVGYVMGVSAPPGKTMGHASTIIRGGGGTGKEKIEALGGCGGDGGWESGYVAGTLPLQRGISVKLGIF